LQAGSFSCSVSLNAGANSISIAATDVAGNTSTKLLNVTLSSGQPVIADFTPKTGPVGTLITLSGTSLVTGSSTQVTLAQPLPKVGFYDPTTGNDLSVFQYPQLWTDPRGGNGAPGGLTQQVASSTLTGWTPETGHQPDLSYVAYMLTGDQYYLDQLNAQANASILSVWPGSRGPSTPYDIIVDNGGTLASWGGQQVRGKAWGLREIDEAAYANPDGSAEKAYFTQVSNDNWSWLVSQLPTWTAAQGEAYGQIQGGYSSNGIMAPWQQDYFASTTIAAAGGSLVGDDVQGRAVVQPQEIDVRGSAAGRFAGGGLRHAGEPECPRPARTIDSDLRTGDRRFASYGRRLRHACRCRRGFRIRTGRKAAASPGRGRGSV
jgi:hypothetical protein